MTTDSLRVVHYTRFHAADRWGGREQVVDQYCRGLQKHGIESEIYATCAFAEPGPDHVFGVPVKRFPYFYPYFPMGADRKARFDTKGGNPLSPGLLRALRDNPPDLLHLHTGARLGAQAARFCRRAGIPVVYSLHGGQFVVPQGEASDIVSGTRGLLDWGKAVGWWAGARELSRNVDRLLCVGKNEHLAAQAEGFENADYLPNGVDEVRFAGGDGERFRAEWNLQGRKIILCCGRIDTQKNQVGLVRELAPLLKERSDHVLVLVGSTTNTAYREKVIAEARGGGVEEQVIFTGNLSPDGPDLANVYASCDVFVLPSVAEPFGIVILEAWAASRPVVASGVDGIPFFVENEKNGLLVDPQADGEIREGVIRVLEDDALAQRLATAGRESVEREFTWTAITGSLAELYRELLQPAGVA